MVRGAGTHVMNLLRVLPDRLDRELAPPKARIAQVECDTMQPGHGGNVRPKGVPMAIRTQEGVLEDLLRDLTVPREAVGRPVDQGPMSLEERLECAEVVFLHAQNQLMIDADCNGRHLGHQVGFRGDRGSRGLAGARVVQGLLLHRVVAHSVAFR